MSLENTDENNNDEKNIEIKNENNILDNEDNSKTQSNSQKKSEKNSNNSDSESESESENNISKKNNDLNISNNNENQDEIKIDINNNNMNLSNLSEDKNNYEILRDFKGKHDFSFKAIIIGDAFVGKSSLINQAIKKQFKTTYAPTLGFDYFVFHIRIKNKIIKLQIWDTCGQEIYKSLVTNFYRNSSVAFMVYAINDRNSFEHIDNWLKEIKYNSSPDTKIFLIGNKCDLINERKVTYEEGLNYSNNYEFNGFYEVSAKTGEKTEEIMIKAAKALYDDYSDYLSDKVKNKNDDLVSDDRSTGKISVSSSRSGINQSESHSGKNCC